MELPRIVVDNSAILPAFFPEPENARFDAGLVNNRSLALVRSILLRRVNAYVPPSFFREFLNVSTRPLFERRDVTVEQRQQIRGAWEDIVTLRLIVLPVGELLHFSGSLTFDDGCPATDARYVAAAHYVQGTLWISHEQRDGIVQAAKKHVAVRLLSMEAPAY